MFGFLKLNFEAALPSIETYELAKIPTRKVVINPETKVNVGQVINGKEWQTRWVDGQTMEAERAQSPGAPNIKQAILTAADQAFLDEYAPTWRKNPGLAKVMKSHWAEGLSAQKIQEYHTAETGKIEPGFSERNAANFIKAFRAAQAETDTQKPLSVEW